MVMQVFIGVHLTTFLGLGAGYTSGTTLKGFWDWYKNELLHFRSILHFLIAKKYWHRTKSDGSSLQVIHSMIMWGDNLVD